MFWPSLHHPSSPALGGKPWFFSVWFHRVWYFWNGRVWTQESFLLVEKPCFLATLSKWFIFWGSTISDDLRNLEYKSWESTHCFCFSFLLCSLWSGDCKSSDLLGREKRGELQDTGHPRPESQMTARPFEFAYILLTLMFSTVACSEVICSKWNVLLNLSRICNSAERDLKSVSFVFLGTDQRSIYWLNEFSNLPKVIKEGSLHSPARGILKLKTDTPLSERYTRPKHHASLEK